MEQYPTLRPQPRPATESPHIATQPLALGPTTSQHLPASAARDIPTLAEDMKRPPPTRGSGQFGVPT